MRPKVFIIILNYNNPEDVRECLKSLSHNDYPNYQVVIIDNGAKKKVSISDLKFPKPLKIIYSQENLGFAGGNNIGIKYALEKQADYVLLLNDDTIVDSGFLTELVKAGERNKDFGLLGPKICYFDDKDRIWSAGGKLNWLYTKGILRGWNQIDQGQYDSPEIQETAHLTGCCLLVKRKVVEKIGLMPEEYFLYYEDTDWSLRAKKAGFKCVFVPRAKIWHKISRSAIAGSKRYIYYHIRNGLIFANRFAPFYLKPLIHLGVLFRILKQPIKLLIPGKRKWVQPILLGIKDFYFKKWGKNENWH